MIMGERVILLHHFDQGRILPKKEQVTELFQNSIANHMKIVNSMCSFKTALGQWLLTVRRKTN